MIMQHVIRKGVERSHNIAFTSIRPMRKQLHSNPDIVFLTDIFNFPHTLKSLGCVRRFRENFFYNCTKHVKFIHFANAYSDICNLAHLPCSGKASLNCPYKMNMKLHHRVAIRDFSTKCFAEKTIVQYLYKESALNIFLSPLHHSTINGILKLDGHPSFVLKPTIDHSIFYNMNLERDIDYLFVGLIGEAKGLSAMRDRFQNQNIYLIGNIAPDEKLDFGNYLGFLPYTKIPIFMNRAKNFVFFPRWPEPQGRVVVEAALCGCNIIANNNVGALSFGFDISQAQHYENSASEFWERIENL